MRRNSSPTVPAKVIDVEATPVAEPLAQKVLQPVSVVLSADKNGLLKVEARQEPGALRASLGSRSDDDGAVPAAFAAQALNDLLQIALASGKPEKFPEGPVNAEALNAMIQAAAAFEPADELEGMIAIQAAALHRVTMDSLARAQRQADVQIRATNIGHANKCSRTFVALVEALNRHRGKITTQRVIVENVNVAAGGQAVVGAVTGVGSKQNGVVQTHANAETSHGRAHARAPLTALPSPNAKRETVPASGGEESQTLPDARRRGRDRRSEGQPKSVDARSLQRGGHRSASDDPSAAAKRERSDLVGAP